jgi:hypothetical protein
LREYRIKPDELREMAVCDVWMIQYAELAMKINADEYQKQMEEKKQGGSGLKIPIEGL